MPPTSKQMLTKQRLMRNTDIKERQALELRRKGLEYSEIAKIVGYKDRSGAHRAVNRLMAREDSITIDMVKEYKREQMAILAEMEEKLIPRIGVPVLRIVRGKEVIDDDGDVAVIDRILKIMDRRSKLLGLDAPIKTDTNINHTLSHEDALDALDDNSSVVIIEEDEQPVEE